MREIVREKFSDIVLAAGDILSFRVKDEDTGEVFFSHTMPVTRHTVINEAAVFELADGELGFKNGHALVAGESSG